VFSSACSRQVNRSDTGSKMTFKDRAELVECRRNLRFRVGKERPWRNQPL